MSILANIAVKEAMDRLLEQIERNKDEPPEVQIERIRAWAEQTREASYYEWM